MQSDRQTGRQVGRLQADRQAGKQNRSTGRRSYLTGYEVSMKIIIYYSNIHVERQNKQVT